MRGACDIVAISIDMMINSEDAPGLEQSRISIFAWKWTQWSALTDGLWPHRTQKKHTLATTATDFDDDYWKRESAYLGKAIDPAWNTVSVQ